MRKGPRYLLLQTLTRPPQKGIVCRDEVTNLFLNTNQNRGMQTFFATANQRASVLAVIVS
jgi:hypothetical protein